MKRFVELHVARVLERSERRLAIAARCYRGPLRCGDELTWLYQLNAPRVGLESGETTRNEDAAITLRVIEIESYKHSVEEIDTGMTPRISIEGDDLTECETEAL